jgi:hypothetical protein
MSKRAANTAFVLRGYEFYSGQDLIDECVWDILSAEVVGRSLVGIGRDCAWIKAEWWI